MELYDAEPILKLHNFSLDIGRQQILKNLDFNVYPGETVLLYGPRNSGKSTLLRSFVHLNEELYKKVDWKGVIDFNGKDIRTIDKKLIRSQITYLDASFVDTLDFLTLRELMKYSLGLSPKDLTKEHYELLEKLGIEHIFSDLDSLKYYNNFSRWSQGEKISMITFISLARNPQIFLFDTILDHVDDSLLREIKNILFRIKKDITLIISTRNLKQLSDICQKIIYMEHGEIKYTGSISSFLLNYPGNTFKIF